MPRRLNTCGLVLVLAAMLGLVGCATNPVSGQRQFSLVTSAQEEQIGHEGYTAVVAEYGLYEDQKVQAYVNEVGQKLARVSHLPNLTWHFTVVDDPAVNAFAMPGGYIYVARGILPYLGSEAQLAGVLGHEIGHVTARHTAQMITQQQVATLGLGLAGLFSTTFRRFSGAAQTALGILFLKYSRDHETQADELGVEYATRAGYDPREIPATYQTLKRVGERSDQRLPDFLSTHPDPGGRETRTRALAEQAASGKTGLVVRGRPFVEKLGGMVFGRDPRQGYFEGAMYYHPSLAFQMTFPSGWRYQDTHSSVAAASPGQTAIEQLSLVSGSLSPGAFVAELERNGRILGSRGGNETIGGYAAWVGHVIVAADDGSQTPLIAAFIRRSSDAMFQILGRSAATGDADESRIFSSIRSLRPLTDPARLRPGPQRVQVLPAPHAGGFASIVRSLGPQALDVDETAILNNTDLDRNVAAGDLLKIVSPARTR